MAPVLRGFSQGFFEAVCPAEKNGHGADVRRNSAAGELGGQSLHERRDTCVLSFQGTIKIQPLIKGDDDRSGRVQADQHRLTEGTIRLGCGAAGPGRLNP
ncbi:MAG: hypothetical protein ACE5ID_02385 [Acidobacteriota bacterium]